jgi:endogenous inhibitor of DNA gyrase (YacG/DUF329 family)
MNNQKKINCPSCGKAITWSHENANRPFCSARCKLIDLGEWANETRKIPGAPAYRSPNEDEDESNL